MRRPRWSIKTSKNWLLLAALPAIFLLGFVAFVFLRAQHSLERAGKAVAQQGRFPVELRNLDASNPDRRNSRLPNPGFEAIASPATYASGAFYQGKLYVSGPSGLFVYGADDTLLKTYRVGLDLPTAPLGAMVVGRLRGASEPELIVATAGEGILIFSGTFGDAEGKGTFRQIRPQDAEVRNVTALLALPTGELLIGTRHHGLLVYRGQDAVGTNYLETFHPQLASLSVTALAADASGVWVGTRNQGLRHWHAGQIDTFEAGPEGGDSRQASTLPDNQVDAIAVHAEKVYVGTPLGVEEFDDGQPTRVLARNLFAHALFADDKELTIGSMDEGLRRVALTTARRAAVLSNDFGISDGEPSSPAQALFRADPRNNAGDLYAVTHDGLRRRREDGSWSSLDAGTAARSSPSAVLTDGNISALAFGADGRLWVGYFDRGLDVVATEGLRIEHHEDDHLFCINRIVLDPRRGTMAVATANGLVLFDAESRPRQVMTRRDGLIADHVNDIAFSRESMVLATPAGLTFVDADGARSLYAFQGLVNNHVYALGAEAHSDRVLAGTLGGVSILSQEAVKNNLTAANSGLKQNWITAIVPAGDSEPAATWMVGTYGEGVMQLGEDGRFSPMEGVTRAMVVNSNAMLTTSTHIFAGTLGQGLWMFERASGRWTQITAGLPSENVTALAAQNGNLYVGTDNGLVRIAERQLDQAY